MLVCICARVAAALMKLRYASVRLKQSVTHPAARSAGRRAVIECLRVVGCRADPVTVPPVRAARAACLYIVSFIANVRICHRSDIRRVGVAAEPHVHAVGAPIFGQVADWDDVAFDHWAWEPAW